MKEKIVTFLTIVIGIVVLSAGGIFLAVIFGILEPDPEIRLEADARKMQRIEEEWAVEKSVSDEVTAMIFYAEDKSDHTVSVYVKRNPLFGPFGYNFWTGGDIPGNPDNIFQYKIEGFSDTAFISMNGRKVSKASINYNGKTIEEIPIDSEKPFAMIARAGEGNHISFVDSDGIGVPLKMRTYSVNEPYEYPVLLGTEEWIALETKEKRYEAVQIPEDILHSMSTKALVETVVRCPIYVGLGAYNVPEIGFSYMRESFNGLEELCLREDAKYELEKYALKIKDDESMRSYYQRAEEILKYGDLVEYVYDL